MNKTTQENERKAQLFRNFQDFQKSLTLEEMEKLRRNIIAIEKALFWKGGAK